MNYYALFYRTMDGYLQERAKYRDEHLKLAREYRENGHLVLAGAFDDPADEALLIFKGETAEIARAFAENDPYVNNGLIK